LAFPDQGKHPWPCCTVCTGSGQKNGQLPDREQLFQFPHDIGFEEDVLWLGIKSVVPEEKVHEYRCFFLTMRKIIHMELGDQFEEVVEFFV